MQPNRAQQPRIFSPESPDRPVRLWPWYVTSAILAFSIVVMSCVACWRLGYEKGRDQNTLNAYKALLDKVNRDGKPNP